MEAFPGSMINHNLEFVAHVKTNEYFRLDNCESELDVKCKVLEWLSRSAHKGQPFRGEKANVRFRKAMQEGINRYLGTDFDEDDFDDIYTRLGNCVNHGLTLWFVESGYDMGLLREGRK